jgi:hypothetical protein
MLKGVAAQESELKREAVGRICEIGPRRLRDATETLPHCVAV